MIKSFIFRKLKIVHKNNILCDMIITKDDYYGAKEPTSSIIIGNNASGKSFILMVIAEIFDSLDNQRNLAMLKYEYYDLGYRYNRDEYRIMIINRSLNVYKNGIEVGKEELKLPQKVLGVSYMLNDKFKFKTDNETIYQYLGIRLTSNSSYTSTISNKLFDNFFGLMTNKRLSNIITNISDFLDIDSKIMFTITPTTKRFFTYSKSEKMIKNRITKYKNDYRYEQLIKLEKSDIKNIINFLDEIGQNKKYIIENDKQVYKFIVTTADNDNKRLKLINDYKIIRNLRNLGYIKSTSLTLYKNGIAYPFEDASSGEKHFIYELVSIANNIKNNALILVDEPEISMHPNWQMRYISTLKNVFSDFPSCHFIIATHSHYLVSDLNPQSSSLISIDYNSITKERKSELLDYSTYAWSAENILYNVFGVRTTRNFYFEMDMRTLLKIISQKDYKQLEYARELCEKLKKYVYDEKDPLCRIIDAAEEFVESDKTD